MTALEHDTPDNPNESVEIEILDAAELPHTFEQRQWPKPWMGTFLDALASFGTATQAADIARINRQHAHAVRSSNAVFADAWNEAKAIHADNVEYHVHRWGTTGLPVRETRTKYGPDGKTIIERTVVEKTDINARLAELTLKTLKPEYRDTLRFAGHDDGPIQIEERRIDEGARILNDRVASLAAARRARDGDTGDGA